MRAGAAWPGALADHRSGRHLRRRRLGAEVRRRPGCRPGVRPSASQPRLASRRSGSGGRRAAAPRPWRISATQSSTPSGWTLVKAKREPSGDHCRLVMRAPSGRPEIRALREVGEAQQPQAGEDSRARLGAWFRGRMRSPPSRSSRSASSEIGGRLGRSRISSHCRWGSSGTAGRRRRVDDVDQDLRRQCGRRCRRQPQQSP